MAQQMDSAAFCFCYVFFFCVCRDDNLIDFPSSVINRRPISHWFVVEITPLSYSKL